MMGMDLKCPGEKILSPFGCWYWVRNQLAGWPWAPRLSWPGSSSEKWRHDHLNFLFHKPLHTSNGRCMEGLCKLQLNVIKLHYSWIFWELKKGGGGPCQNPPNCKANGYFQKLDGSVWSPIKNFLYCQELSTYCLRNPVPSWGQNIWRSFKNWMDYYKINYPLTNKHMKVKCNFQGLKED